MNKKQIEKWIIKNCIDENGYLINLNKLDFGDYWVNLAHLKAQRIYNDNQKADRICNDNQEAETIFNFNQKAKEIFNSNQILKGDKNE